MVKQQITSAERKRLAEKHGINEQYLYQCLTGRREMKPAEAMRLETESGGVLTRQMLCQKSASAIWPDLPPVPAPAIPLPASLALVERRVADLPIPFEDRRARPAAAPGEAA